MTDLPILFSAPMVLALLQNRKTQTRRLVMTSDEIAKGPWLRSRQHESGIWQVGSSKFNSWKTVPVRHQIGDRLYVRERIHKWLSLGNPDMAYVSYSADECETFRPWPDGWKRDFAPPMHMPKQFSRITLAVTGVKMERLQDISEEDAIAEGVAGFPDEESGLWFNARDAYQMLWDRLNAKRAPWASNPWVVAYTFSVHKTNIERMAA